MHWIKRPLRATCGRAKKVELAHSKSLAERGQSIKRDIKL